MTALGSQQRTPQQHANAERTFTEVADGAGIEAAITPATR